MNSAQQLWLEQVGSVLETLNQGVIINDERKQIVFANSMFLEMIKMRASDLLGHSIVSLYPPEDVPRLLEFITRRETHGRALYEFYIPQADGGRLPVAVTSRQSWRWTVNRSELSLQPTYALSNRLRHDFWKPTPNWNNGIAKSRRNSSSQRACNRALHQVV